MFHRKFVTRKYNDLTKIINGVRLNQNTDNSGQKCSGFFHCLLESLKYFFVMNE